MSGKEKIYFLLNRIKDVRDITPSSSPLKIHPMNDLRGNYQAVELQQLFVKLERDEKILSILKVPNRFKTIDFVEGIIPDEPIPENDDGCWHIELLPAFDGYFLKIQHEPEYQEFTGKTPPSEIPSKQQAGDKITESILRKAIFATPTYSTKSKQIADQYSPENYQFVLRVLKEIISLSEFSPDGKVHYELQSPSGQEVIKERSLLRKFESEGLFEHLGENGISGIATLSNLDTKLIKEVIARLEERESGVITSEEFEEIKESDGNFITETAPSKSSNQTEELEGRNAPRWQDDFKWQGKKFVFGQYGSTGVFNSKTRRTLFHELTEAKGNWVTVRKLKQAVDKDEAYVRPTIGQIERSFDISLRRYISIPSTVTDEDDLPTKPQQGAYRIKFTPNSL